MLKKIKITQSGGEKFYAEKITIPNEKMEKEMQSW
jgi:hypothetical protein